MISFLFILVLIKIFGISCRKLSQLNNNVFKKEDIVRNKESFHLLSYLTYQNIKN